MTYNELIYMVLDEIKANSDDSFINEEHARFLLGKYRNSLLYQQYKDNKKRVAESNYQTICIDLEEVDAIDGSPCTGESYLRSTIKIPDVLEFGINKVYSVDYFQDNITFINRDRFKYVGNNKYTKNVIYSTIGSDDYLYLKSENPQYRYLQKLKFTGVFNDVEKASLLECDKSEEGCDVGNKEFPIEEQLVPMLIQAVVKDLLGISYRPKDNINNSTDDLSTIAQYLRNNLKTPVQE